MMELIKNECTGCNVCSYICPANAIMITEEANGFSRRIDEKRCTDCQKCEKNCHLNQTKFNIPQMAYTVQSRDFHYRKIGASGGVASTLYRYALQQGYACIGTAFSNGQLVYKTLKSESDIDKSSGSKYVRSSLEILLECGAMQIEANNPLIFVGLPCHCAAMKNVLSENVLWIDLVCNGVCPLSELHEDLRQNGIEATTGDIRFREKNNQYGITVRGHDRQIIRKISSDADDYMQRYIKGSNRYRFCEACKYVSRKRIGDITLKDYVWKYGVSNVLINSKKGTEFWEQVKHLFYVKEYPLDRVFKEDERINE